MAGMKTMLVLMALVVLASQSGVAMAKKKPSRLVFYSQDIRSGDNATSYVITNSSLGYLAVYDQAIYSGPTVDSSEVGRQYGQATNVVKAGVPNAYFIFLTIDIHINTTEYVGSFLLQSAVNSALEVRTMVITGGTGDFYLARGFSQTRFIEGTDQSQSAVVKYVIHFKWT